MDIFPWKCLAVAALALVASGCGNSGPRLYKAGGTVTDNKVPIEGAQVTFAYDDGNFANGFTDGAGKFQLSYVNRPGGAFPGKCTVTISKKGGVAGSAAPAAANAAPKTAEEHKAKMEAEQRQRQEYAQKQAALDRAGGGSGDFTKSGLVLEITTDESKNNFVIDLKDFK